MNWSRAFQNIRLRAEQENLSNLVFTDSLRILNNVKGKRNIQLTGRRGTGKTSLLLKLHKDYLAQYRRDVFLIAKSDFLPISINISKLNTIPLYDTEDNSIEIIQNPLAQAANNFRRIIQMILWGYDDIGGLYEYVNKYPVGPITKQRTKRKLRKLEEYLKNGENRIRLIEREISQSEKSNVDLGGSASISFNANQNSPLSAGVTSGLVANKRFERDFAQKIFATAQLSLKDVSNLLVDVVKSLRCEQMLLLIDEWSAGQNPVESQPFLLELMKPLFFSNPAISVKMAIVPEHYQEYNSIKLQGLEPHSGYFIPVNLDSLQPYGRNRDKTVRVLREIASEHLRSQMKRKLSPHIINKNNLIDNFFKDSKIFLQTVIASEGNIRDFLLILGRVYDDFLNEKHQESFSGSNVRKGISEHFVEDKWKRINDQRLRSIFIDLCSRITAREIRVVDTGQDQNISKTLSKLKLFRLLHSSREDCMVDGQLYRFFYVDFAGYQHIRDENPGLFPNARLPKDPTPEQNPVNVETIDPVTFFSESINDN
jgi:hypothetical protein